MSTFEDSLKERIQRERGIKPNSIRTYILTLRRLRNLVNGSTSRLPLSDLSFLNDHKKVMEVINPIESLVVRKNLLTSVLVGLSKNSKRRTKYNELLKTLSDEYTEKLKDQKKTPKQEANWLDYKEIKTILDKLAEETKGDNPNYNKLQQHVALATYMTFPTRNDYANMAVLTSDEYNSLPENEKKSENFLVAYGPTTWKFHINSFKNSKRLGSKILVVPAHLLAIIKRWLQFNQSNWFLTKPDKQTPLNPTELTNFIQSIFKGTGKKIGSSMLRHILITHLSEGEPTIREEEERASMFFHSAGMNKLYRKI